MNRFEIGGPLTALFIFGLLVPGCEPSPAPGAGPVSLTNPSPPTPRRRTPGTAPSFRGITDLLAGDDSLHIEWHPAARDDVRYRVYTSSRPGKQDFSRPRVETAPGATHVRLSSLDHGQTLYCVVRAVDGDGHEDDNELEWSGTPNPVRYISAAAPEGGDGKSPDAPYRSIDDAVGAAIALDGVNIYVAQGTYRESLFLFDGMMLYGSFDDSFSSRSDQISTRIEPETSRTLVHIAPGSRPSGLDGVELDGRELGERGVVAEECEIRITNTTVRHFLHKGIQLRARGDESSLTSGAIRDCRIEQNRGEGIAIEGRLDLEITGSEIVGNAQEGIEAEPLDTVAGEKARLTVEDCRIAGNGDLGVQIELGLMASSSDEEARSRVTLRRCVVEDNGDYGASFDVSFEPEARVDCRVRVEGNLVARNGRGGIHVDGDAAGAYRLAGNTIRGNRGSAGVVLGGSHPDALYRLIDDRVLGNEGGGVLAMGPGTVVLQHCLFARNQGPAIHALHSWVSAEACVVTRHGEDSTLDAFSRGHTAQPIPLRGIETPVAASPGDPDPTIGPRVPELADAALSPPDRRHDDLEATRIHPAPGSWIEQARFELHFNRAPEPELLVALTTSGGPVPAHVSNDGHRVEIRAANPAAVGTRLRLGIGPWVGTSEVPRSWQLELPYVVAARLPGPGDSITELPAAGTGLLGPSDPEHEWSIEVPEGETCQAELAWIDPPDATVELSITGREGSSSRVVSSPAVKGSPLVVRVTSNDDEAVRYRLRVGP